jgi:hypothetical protein
VQQRLSQLIWPEITCNNNSNNNHTTMCLCDWTQLAYHDCRHLIADHWVRSQASPCGTCGRYSGTGTGFSPSPLVPLNHCSIRCIHSFRLMSFKQLCPSVLRDSVREAKYLGFYQVVKRRYFWQYVRTLWLSHGGRNLNRSGQPSASH